MDSKETIQRHTVIVIGRAAYLGAILCLGVLYAAVSAEPNANRSAKNSKPGTVRNKKEAGQGSGGLDDALFHLGLAREYEKGGFLEKAEKEYLLAGEHGSPAAQQEAITAIERINQKLGSRKLDLGLAYETERKWPEAEQQFEQAAAESEVPQIRAKAIAGLKRSLDAQNSVTKNFLNTTEFLPNMGLVATRFLLLLGVGVVCWVFVLSLRDRFRATDILSFGGNKKIGEQLKIAFPAIRARAQSVIGGGVYLPDVVQGGYPFVSPSLTGLLPDEPFEIGGLKIPGLDKLLKLIARPRLEITGGALDRAGSLVLYAEVWRRRAWFGSRLLRTVSREVPKGPEMELEPFVYDVCLNANASVTAKNA